MGKVDKSICIWCGTCVTINDKLFKIEEDEKAACFKQPENDEEKASFEDARNSCPVGAIWD